MNFLLKLLFKGIESNLSLNDHILLKDKIIDLFENQNHHLILDKDSGSPLKKLTLHEFKDHLKKEPLSDFSVLSNQLIISDVNDVNDFNNVFESVFLTNNSLINVSEMREVFYKSKYIHSASDEGVVKFQLDKLINDKEWNTLTSFHWGISYILFASIELLKFSSSRVNKAYYEACSERILRKLEIGKSKTIDFINTPSNDNANLLEQSRIIFFCLKASEELNDLRFLNAALNAMDRIFTSIKALARKKDLSSIDIEILILYLYNLKKQEYLIKNTASYENS